MCYCTYRLNLLEVWTRKWRQFKMNFIHGLARLADFKTLFFLAGYPSPLRGSFVLFMICQSRSQEPGCMLSRYCIFHCSEAGAEGMETVDYLILWEFWYSPYFNFSLFVKSYAFGKFNLLQTNIKFSRVNYFTSTWELFIFLITMKCARPDRYLIITCFLWLF